MNYAQDLAGNILYFKYFEQGKHHDVKFFIPNEVNDLLLTVEGTLVGGGSKVEVAPILKIDNLELIQH